MTTTTTAIAALAVLVLLALALSLKIITQYERGIVFRLGRLRPVYEPGLHLVVPFLERLVRVDTRVVTLTIPPQEVITEDNVPARVNAVVLFNVTDPVKAVMAVENYAIATSQIAQTTLRSVLGRVDLDTVLAHRSALNADLRDIIEKLTEPWGVEVSVVEIKDVEIPEQMQRAMARGAEAERERRAKIINARGALHVDVGMREGINPIGDERGGEQGTGNNAQQIHTPIVRHLCPSGKPNGPATPKQRDESGATHSWRGLWNKARPEALPSV